jgi:hypothetical protein
MPHETQLLKGRPPTKLLPTQGYQVCSISAVYSSSSKSCFVPTSITGPVLSYNNSFGVSSPLRPMRAFFDMIEPSKRVSAIAIL